MGGKQCRLDTCKAECIVFISGIIFGNLSFSSFLDFSHALAAKLTGCKLWCRHVLCPLLSKVSILSPWLALLLFEDNVLGDWLLELLFEDNEVTCRLKSAVIWGFLGCSEALRTLPRQIVEEDLACEVMAGRWGLLEI